MLERSKYGDFDEVLLKRTEAERLYKILGKYLKI